MASRFFLDVELAPGACVTLPPAVAHHALRVLRLRDGTAITLFNGRGGEYVARLGIEPPTAQIERFDPIERESPLELTLIQASIANDKLDWVIEKAVELGVTRVLIAPATRSVVRLRADRRERRLAHWRDVVAAACCQCGRNRLPQIDAANALDDALKPAFEIPQRFVLAPDATFGLAGARARPTCIAVGPEGGFTDEELHAAERLGFVRARWGPRVLRTETAGLAALAALQTLHGDCGR